MIIIFLLLIIISVINITVECDNIYTVQHTLLLLHCTIESYLSLSLCRRRRKHIPFIVIHCKRWKRVCFLELTQENGIHHCHLSFPSVHIVIRYFLLQYICNHHCHSLFPPSVYLQSSLSFVISFLQYICNHHCHSLFPPSVYLQWVLDRPTGKPIWVYVH